MVFNRLFCYGIIPFMSGLRYINPMPKPRKKPLTELYPHSESIGLYMVETRKAKGLTRIALGTSSDAFLGLNGSEIDTPSLKLVKRLKKIEALPPPKQKALLQTIDGFLKDEGM